MKTYVLSISLSLFITYKDTAGIKNGFASEIRTANTSIESLRLLLADADLSIFQRMSVQKKIKDLETFILNFELTERLLMHFKMISPEMYSEIETITDHRGRPVDVYVKFLPENAMPRGIVGMTNIAQAPHDEDMYVSEHGLNSVSIHVLISNKSLLLLAHEFGHVKYQVPNLASYSHFYVKQYVEYGSIQKNIGHNDRDQSGKFANEYERHFKMDFIRYKVQCKGRVESIYRLNHAVAQRFKSNPRQILRRKLLSPGASASHE